MRKIASVAALDDYGRIQLSEHFFMRAFLYSEIANFHGLQNIPHDPDLAIEAGRKLCETLLEPLHARFGAVTVRSGYRSPSLNRFGNEMQRAGKRGYSCATNAATAGSHIWDQRDGRGALGACASIVIPAFIPLYQRGVSWTQLAWWIHDHLDYSEMYFFPKNAAFNLTWSEIPKRVIKSYIPPRGTLTKPGMDNHHGDHSPAYQDLAKI